jgi:FkbM family methyltransferase
MVDIQKELNLLKSRCFDTFDFYYRQDDIYVGCAIAKNVYENFETLIMLSHVKQGDVVVDVGANIGYYSLLLASRIGEKGRLYAIEPDPTNRAILELNIKANNIRNIIVLDCAITAEVGNVDLYLSEKNFGDHRLCLDKNETQARSKISVRAETLDHLFSDVYKEDKINLIKIDTQGHEPFVVIGATKIIQTHKPALLFEYWPYGYLSSKANAEEMIQFLRGQYQDIIFIDREDRRFFIANDTFIGQYCKKIDGTMHSDLMCSPYTLEQIRKQILTTHDKLTRKIKDTCGI